jgi:hypothetical protein
MSLHPRAAPSTRPTMPDPLTSPPLRPVVGWPGPPQPPLSSWLSLSPPLQQQQLGSPGQGWVGLIRLVGTLPYTGGYKNLRGEGTGGPTHELSMRRPRGQGSFTGPCAGSMDQRRVLGNHGAADIFRPVGVCRQKISFVAA